MAVRTSVAAAWLKSRAAAEKRRSSSEPSPPSTPLPTSAIWPALFATCFPIIPSRLPPPPPAPLPLPPDAPGTGSLATNLSSTSCTIGPTSFCSSSGGMAPASQAPFGPRPDCTMARSFAFPESENAAPRVSGRAARLPATRFTAGITSSREKGPAPSMTSAASTNAHSSPSPTSEATGSAASASKPSPSSSARKGLASAASRDVMRSTSGLTMPAKVRRNFGSVNRMVWCALTSRCTAPHTTLHLSSRDHEARQRCTPSRSRRSPPARPKPPARRRPSRART
jgi:hypothetical protein